MANKIIADASYVTAPNNLFEGDTGRVDVRFTIQDSDTGREICAVSVFAGNVDPTKTLEEIQKQAIADGQQYALMVGQCEEFAKPEPPPLLNKDK